MQNKTIGSPPWSNCTPGVLSPPILNMGFRVLSCLPRSVWTLDFLFQDVALELSYLQVLDKGRWEMKVNPQ